MQHLNDDMEELFRKAADQYPLKTTGADWNKVLQQLNQPPDPDEPKKNDNGGYRKLLWLLLLIPFVWICTKFNGTNDGTVKDIAQAKKESTAVASEEKKSAVESQGKTQPGDTNADAVKTTTDQTLLSRDKTEADKNRGSVIAQQKTGADAFDNTAIHHNDTRLLTKQNKEEVVANNKSNTLPNNTNKTTGENNVAVTPQDAGKKQDDKSAIQNNNITGNNTISPVDNSAAGKLDNTAAKEEAKKDSAQPAVADSAKTEAANKKIKIKQPQQKYFYVGLLTGPDLSSVKLQKLNAGVGIGALAGYRINNRWSVEAGFFWDKKKYYTEGKYFNTDKLPSLPAHTTILNADGDCNMFEIPVNVNYHFGKKGGYNWFVNLGASSYLMNKETYAFLMERYNMQYTGQWDYKHSSKDWFAVLNLGAGYEKQIGKVGKLRLQPYMRVPIRGTGIGKLSLSSGGFYIGFTKKIF